MTLMPQRRTKPKIIAHDITFDRKLCIAYSASLAHTLIIKIHNHVKLALQAQDWFKVNAKLVLLALVLVLNAAQMCVKSVITGLPL